MVTGQQENKNNGSKPFDPNAFNPGSVLRPGHSVGDAYKLIETNDKQRDLLMKAEFLNPDYALKAAMALYYCRHNHLEDEENLVWDYIAGLCAVQGKRAHMLMQGIIGVLDDKPQRSNFWGKRSAESNNKD